MCAPPHKRDALYQVSCQEITFFTYYKVSENVVCRMKWKTSKKSEGDTTFNGRVNTFSLHSDHEIFELRNNNKAISGTELSIDHISSKVWFVDTLTWTLPLPHEPDWCTAVMIYLFGYIIKLQRGWCFNGAYGRFLRQAIKVSCTAAFLVLLRRLTG